MRNVRAIVSAISIVPIVVWCLGLVYVQRASAQGLLDSLLGQPTKGLKIQTPEKQFQAQLKKRLAEVKKSLEAQKKKEKERSKALEQERAQLRKLADKFQRRPKLKALRESKAVMTLRKQIALMIQQNASLIGRLLSAEASYSENLRALRDVIQKLLNNGTKQVEELVKKTYIVPKSLERLGTDLVRLEQQLTKAQDELKLSRKELKDLTQAREKNQAALDQVRRNMVKLAPIPKTTPRLLRPVSPKEIKKSPKRQKPSAARRRRRRPIARKSARRPPPPRRVELTAKELRLQQIKQAVRTHNETLQEQQFEYYRKRSRWLNLRKRDETLDIEIARFKIRLYGVLIAQMRDAAKELASKTRGGLWFYRPLSFDPKLLLRSLEHTGLMLKTRPKEFQGVFIQRLKVLGEKSTSLQVFLALGVLLVLFVGVGGWLALRQRLSKGILRLKERVDSGSITRQMWGLLRLGLQATYDGMPYVLVFASLLFLMWSSGFPPSWLWNVLWFALLLLAVRLGWTLADGLFAADASDRFLATLDNDSARRLRRVVKGFASIAICYVPILMVVHQLDYPEAFTRWMDALFFTFVLIGSLLLLLNKDGILSLIPINNVVGRALVLFIHRFYPMFFFLALGTFGFYLYGYVNFATYLTQGLTFTVLLLSFAYGMYRLIWVFGLWVFGFTKGEGGLLQVEKRWARNVLRLIRMLSGVALAVISIGLLFEIWGIGGGSKSLFQLFNYPFVQVKDTQITLISLGKLLLSVVVAFWLSGFLKRKGKEYVYPALRLSPANQHAVNTVLGYIVIIVGALFGLQWMGVGIGVLAVFAGIVGIGVGFGIQNIASNFISGLIITFGKPIKVGDVIEVDGSMGEVKEISGRSTTIETLDLRIVLIPNSEILTKKVVNWSMGQPCVMVGLNVGVAYGSDVQLVLKTLREVADQHPLVLKTPHPALRFGNFGDNSLEFAMWIAVHDPLRRFEVLSDLRIAVDKRFAELGIVIAFPQRDIHLSPPLEEALIHAAGKRAAEVPSTPLPQTLPTPSSKG